MSAIDPTSVFLPNQSPTIVPSSIASILTSFR